MRRETLYVVCVCLVRRRSNVQRAKRLQSCVTPVERHPVVTPRSMAYYGLYIAGSCLTAFAPLLPSKIFKLRTNRLGQRREPRRAGLGTLVHNDV